MLIRIFRAQAHAGMEEEYAGYLRDVAGPTILASDGAREVQVYEPLWQGGEFLVKSAWEDLASMMSFAGATWWRPRLSVTEVEMVAIAEVSHYRPSAGFTGRIVTARSGRLIVDRVTGTAHIDAEVYRLPPTECRLLAELTANAGRFVTSAALARALWWGSVAMTADDVRRSIYRLRKLIGDHDRVDPVVRSRRGFGYMIEG